jgi:hypothetical protein
VGFGLSTSFGLTLVLLAILGAADMVSVVVRQTLVQAETPDDLRGRVAAVNTVFIGASNELGEFESDRRHRDDHARGPMAVLVSGSRPAGSAHPKRSDEERRTSEDIDPRGTVPASLG